MTRTHRSLGVPLAAIAALVGCAHGHRQTPRDALREYDRRLRAMDSDGIAALYADDGAIVEESGAAIVGPAAVASFLHGFDGQAVVLAQESHVAAERAHGDEVTQDGIYRQRARVGDQTVTVCGRFQLTWIAAGDAWKVHRMQTWPHACRR